MMISTQNEFDYHYILREREKSKKEWENEFVIWFDFKYIFSFKEENLLYNYQSYDDVLLLLVVVIKNL